MAVTDMVRILDGNLERVAHASKGKGVFLKINVFENVVDPNNCIKQKKIPISLKKFAPIFELPSNISTMVTGDL